MRQLDLFGYIEEEKKDAEPNIDSVASPVNLVFVEQEDKKSVPVEEVKIDEKAENPPSAPLHHQAEKKTPSKRGRKSYKEIDAEIVNLSLPDDEELFRKQYYPISEVAGWFSVNASLIRFWENEFDILKPRKTRKGDRLFRPEDVKNIRLIYYLLRQKKYSIEGAKKFLKENKNRADSQMQLLELLTRFKSFLLEWKANLDT